MKGSRMVLTISFYYGKVLLRLQRSTRIFVALASGLVLMLPFVVAAPAFATPNITEYPITDGPNPDTRTIVPGPDGNLWFADNGNDAIGKITPAGVITEYHLNVPASAPNAITAGPDGAMWFTENNVNNMPDQIGRITTDGTVTYFPTDVDATSLGITTGSDGALWFTETSPFDTNSAIGRMTTTGDYTRYFLPTSNGTPSGITTGPDHNMWFTEISGDNIGKITPDGTITEYPTPGPDAHPYFITNGPDGALWFGAYGNNAIDRITTSGTITEFPISTPNVAPYSITTGSDGALWFTEGETNGNFNAIGRMTTDGVSTQYLLPDNYSASELTSGPDGAIWFTSDTGGNLSNIDKLTIPPTGLTELTTSSPTQSAPVLNWGTVDGAVSYNIYRNGSLIDSSNTNSYTDNAAVPGTYTYYVTAVDGSNNESVQSNSVSVVYNAAPSITSASSFSTSVHTPFDFKVTTNANPTATLAEAGTLPTGVTFTDNGDGTADIAGTVPIGSNGTYPITIAADNGINPPASQTFTLNITTNSTAPSFTSSASDTEAYGSPMNFTVTTGGFPLPTLKKNGGLPNGVTFTDNGDGTATISGTPAGNANGVYPITLTAKNSTGSSAQSFNLAITKAPVFKNIPNKQLTATVGMPYSLTVTANGYTTPQIRPGSGIPDGLTFNDNGNGTATISGTPAVGSGGSYSVLLIASNSYGVATTTFTLKVNEAPVITSNDNVSAIPGRGFSFQVTSSGFPAAKYSETGVLPKGVHLTKAGLLSGTPKANAAGTYPITITATNSQGSNSQGFNLTIL